MYSHVVDGVVCDFKFKKLSEQVYGFYVGEYYLGQIHLVRSWYAVSSYGWHLGLGVVKGFKYRMDAAEFLIQVAEKYNFKSV